MKRYLLPALALVLVACLDEREETTDTGATDPDAATDATTADAAVDMLPPDAAPNLLELGAECVAHAECTSGRCSVPCDGYGTCVPAECDADADCAEQGACCVDGACEASTGGTCGDRSGGQGDACSNGPTDCADGVACINRCLAAPFCAAACEGHDECRAADPATACYRTPEGDARCVPDPDQAARCERNADCGPTAVCVPFISFDGTGIIKTCLQTQGGRPVGAACPEHRTCRSTYCLDGRCTAGCAEDADCACEADGCRQQTCLDVWFDYRDEQHPARMCAPLDRCEADADCGEGDACSAYLESDAWATVCGTPSAADKAAGEACAAHGDCRSAACVEEVCAALCADDEHCADGQTCTAVTLEGGPSEEATVGACR